MNEALFPSREAWQRHWLFLLGETIERGVKGDAALAIKVLLEEHDRQNATAVHMTYAQLAARMNLSSKSLAHRAVTSAGSAILTDARRSLMAVQFDSRLWPDKRRCSIGVPKTDNPAVINPDNGDEGKVIKTDNADVINSDNGGVAGTLAKVINSDNGGLSLLFPYTQNTTYSGSPSGNRENPIPSELMPGAQEQEDKEAEFTRWRTTLVNSKNPASVVVALIEQKLPRQMADWKGQGVNPYSKVGQLVSRGRKRNPGALPSWKEVLRQVWCALADEPDGDIVDYVQGKWNREKRQSTVPGSWNVVE